MTRAYLRISLACLALVALSACGCAGVGAAVNTGLEAYAAYCKVPPSGRAAVRAKLHLGKQIIHCAGDAPQTGEPEPTAAVARLTGLL